MHDYSSQHWNDELKKRGIPKVLKIKDNIVSELKPYISNIERIYFAGGEPLITNEHYEMLNFLYDNKNDIDIEYTTNLSIIKSDFENLIEKWKNFNSVHIQVSLDGLYDKGESIRVGMKTQNVFDNILLLQKNNIEYTISFSVANYNVMDIFEFSKELMDKKIVITEDQLEFNNYVLTPNTYSLQNISNKNKVIEYLNNGKVMFKTKRLQNQINDIKSILHKNII